MADEFCHEWDESDLVSLIKIQATCRRWLINKQMKEIKLVYEDLVLELDGPYFTVSWPKNTLSFPVVLKNSKSQAKLSQQNNCINSTNEFQKVVQQSEHIHTKNKNLMNIPGNNETAPHFEKTTGLQRAHQTVQTDSVENKINKNSLLRHDFQKEMYSTDSTENVSEFELAADHKIAPWEHKPVDVSLELKDSPCISDSLQQNAPGVRELKADQGFCAGAKNTLQTITITPKVLNIVSVGGPGTDRECQSIPSSGYSLVSETNIKGKNSFQGDQTSVWDSSSTLWQEQIIDREPTRDSEKSPHHLDKDRLLTHPVAELTPVQRAELVQQRKNIAMELLWVQQAIISRKNYLKLKSQMELE